MGDTEVQALILAHYDLRLEPEMIGYATRKLQSLERIGVIGGDGRTGIARRQIIDRSVLSKTSSRQTDQRTLITV